MVYFMYQIAHPNFERSTEMARIEAKVTLTRMGSYERAAYGYGTETVYIYTMTAEDGTVYVWKTTGNLGRWIDRENYDYEACNKGDILVIKATVKGETEYKGEKQTEVQRVTVKEILFKAETYAERQERLAKERAERVKAQRESIKDGDTIWTQMPYKQYKEHYSDCEIIEGSFQRHESGFCGVDVIIRAGRLKNSGVRGEHFRGYEMTNELGNHCTYRAVSEENALKRVRKDFPEHEWECTKIYR